MLVGRALRLGQTFEVVAWEIVQLKVATWENTLCWEVATWETPLGKYPRSVANWENVLWESLFKYLGNIWENSLGWEVATWENILWKLLLWKMSFGKHYSNIHPGICIGRE